MGRYFSLLIRIEERVDNLKNENVVDFPTTNAKQITTVRK